MGIPAAIVTVLLGLLMVSNVRYYSPKSLDLKAGIPFAGMLGIIALFALVAANPNVVLLLIGIMYGSSGPIQGLLRKRKRPV